MQAGFGSRPDGEDVSGMEPWRAMVCVLCIGCSSVPRLADAQDTGRTDGAPIRRAASTGLIDYRWETPLRSFERLAPEPFYAQVAYSPGRIVELNYDSSLETDDLIATAYQDVAGEGFHTLAEYYIENQ